MMKASLDERKETYKTWYAKYLSILQSDEHRGKWINPKGIIAALGLKQGKPINDLTQAMQKLRNVGLVESRIAPGQAKEVQHRAIENV
jgi:hypothetical protein